MNNRNQANDERTPAHAPYNFIPLPETVIDVRDQLGDRNQIAIEDALPSHDIYNPERRHGYFDVTLTTETPLYIRGTLTPDEAESQLKNKPDFFDVGDMNAPRIPGSSLRGMLRALVEIVGFGKLERMSDKKLFFRNVDNSTLGTAYRDRMVGKDQGQNKVETGFLVKSDDIERPYVICSCEMARVHHDLLNGKDGIYHRQNKANYPNWSVGQWRQNQRVWVKLGKNARFVDVISPTKPNDGGYEEGILVITGDIPGNDPNTGKPKKQREFVFLLRGVGAETLSVPEAIIDRFHDDDQVSQWQQKAFPKDKPTRRSRDGWLQTKADSPGEPVFFLRENDQLTFLGRAGMFRLPYENSPTSLMPKVHNDASIYDLAEALFGFIRRDENKQGAKAKAYAGRVQVTDAHLTPDQANLYEEIITPPILSTPKPTTFQHYLVQPQGVKTRKADLAHYDSAGVKLRGHKLYWRRKRETISGLHQNDAPADSTQHTRIRPLRRGLTFKFCVNFENLTDIELGLLAWVLELPGNSAHRHMLGMGKPFGLGVVKCAPTLMLSDRAARHASLFADNTWVKGEGQADTKPFIESFEGFAAAQHGNQPFQKNKRIHDLSTMLTFWQADMGDTFSYMGLDDFRQRPVLPTPGELKRWLEDLERLARGIQVGDELRTEMLEETDDNDIKVKLLPPFDKGSYHAFLMAQHRRGLPFQNRQPIRVVVLEIEDYGDEGIYLYCRRPEN